MTLTLQLITALTALVAVIVGPVITWRVARSQINANVRANNRQKWINSLRNNLSEFLSSQRLICLYHHGNPFDNEIATESFQKMLQESMIRLLINPNEEDHAELVRLLHESIEMQDKIIATKDWKDSDLDLDGLHDKIIKLSQSILKR